MRSDRTIVSLANGDEAVIYEEQIDIFQLDPASHNAPIKPSDYFKFEVNDELEDQSPRYASNSLPGRSRLHSGSSL